MRQGRGNIEDFLKRKLDNLENHFQDDWDVFEQRLEQAIFLKRLRKMAIMGGFALLLTGAFIGSNYYSYNLHKEPDVAYYQPRVEQQNPSFIKASALQTSYVTEASTAEADPIRQTNTSPKVIAVTTSTKKTVLSRR